MRAPGVHGRLTSSLSAAFGSGLSRVFPPPPHPERIVNAIPTTARRWYVGLTSRRIRMGISNKFLAVLAAMCALAIAPVALGAGGATATATPSHVKAGKSVELKIAGLKPG